MGAVTLSQCDMIKEEKKGKDLVKRRLVEVASHEIARTVSMCTT